MSVSVFRAVRLGTVILLTTAVAACTTTNGGTDTPDPVPTSITLTPTGATIDALGTTVQLTATVLDQNGNTISNAEVTWTSDNEGVATVSQSGQVTAVGNGAANITATSGSATQSVAITVQQVPAEMAIVSGDGQSATVNTALGASLVGQVNDANSNAMEAVGVTLAVTTGGGTLSAAAATTDAAGQFSVDATLGTTAGEQTFTASVTADNGVNGVFTATGTPDTPTDLVLASGNNQSAFVNAQLPFPIVVQAQDQFGNGVSGVDVVFEVLGGGGFLTPTDATTDATGNAATAWTLGPNLGTNTAQATSAGLTGSPVMFTAEGSTLGLTSVSPDPVVEGASATLTGTGFDPTPANNTVMVDGVAATVTAATTTTLTVTMPTFDCKPARAVDFSVGVGGSTSNTVSHTVNPPAFVNLAVGAHQIVQTDLCLQFDANVASETYLVGVQSTSETVSELTPVTFSGEAPPLTPAPPVTAAYTPQAFGSPFDAFDTPQRRRLDAHRAAEAEIRTIDQRMHERLRGFRAAGRTPTVSAFAVDSTVSVGDQFNIEVWDRAGGSCDDSETIQVTVRAKGTFGIWLSDDANEANGYSDTDYQNLSDQFDADIYPTDVDFFGEPTDIDDNARVVIVITKEVNKIPNLLGFVISCDLFSNTVASASNEGEFFYGKAPEPTGGYPVANALQDAPFVIAHEFAHVIQQSRRNNAGNSFLDGWLAEGQATLAEEVVGHGLEGHDAGQDLGFAEAWNDDNAATIDWYANAFVDMYRYFGYNNNDPRIPNAPEECSWLENRSQATDAPCTGGRKVYGVPWSLLRYITDRYAGTFPGGAQGIQRAVIDRGENGYALLEAITGESIENVLARWAASLYVDGRVAGLGADLDFPSWDLLDVFEGSCCGGTTRPASARLVPEAVVFGAFSNDRNVRAASTLYSLLSGARSALAVKARQLNGTALPAHMQMFIVRVN